MLCRSMANWVGITAASCCEQVHGFAFAAGSISTQAIASELRPSRLCCPQEALLRWRPRPSRGPRRSRRPRLCSWRCRTLADEYTISPVLDRAADHICAGTHVFNDYILSRTWFCQSGSHVCILYKCFQNWQLWQLCLHVSSPF